MKKIPQHLWWIACVSTVGSFILYGQTISGQFVYDDLLFSNRQDLRSPATLMTIWWQSTAPNALQSGGYRPFTFFTFALQFILFGDSPVSFHIFNILIHAWVSVLVYVLIYRLFRQRVLALFTSILFLVLPIHAENVSSIKYRDDMLAATWIIAAWLFFLYGQERKRFRGRWYLWSAGCYGVSLLSKELLLLSPFMFVTVSFLQQSKQPLKNMIIPLRFYGGTLVIYTILRLMAYGNQAFDKDYGVFLLNPLLNASWWTRIWTSGKIAYSYIAKTLVPTDLSITYAYNHFPVVADPLQSWQMWVGFLLIIGGLWVAWYKPLRSTPLGVGAVIFLWSYLLMSKLFFQAADIFAERWMYFPSLGVILPVAWGFSELYKRYRVVAVAAFLLVVAVYTSVVWQRAAIWQNWETLYASMIRDAPQSAWGRYSAAQYYMTHGKLERAQEEAQAAYEIYPTYYPTLIVSGQIAGLRQQYDRAKLYLMQAMLLNPSNPTAHLYYALMLSKEGKYEESIAYIRPQLERNPNDPSLRYLMAENLFRMGNLEEARQYSDGLPLPIEQKISPQL